jgi:hypothetical protein
MEWEPYPIPIGESQGGMVGNSFYVVSGFSGSFSTLTKRVYGFDTTNPNAEWVRMDDVPVPAFSHSSYAVDGQYMYICGAYVGPTPGPDSDICLKFTPNNGSGSQWSFLPKMPISRGGGGLLHIQATNSLLYATGSTRRGSTVDYQDVYELFLDNLSAGWIERQDIPYKANHVSHVTAIYQGKQRHYIAGGQIQQKESDGNQRDNYEWDGTNKVWIKRADMKLARGHASSSTVGYGCGYLMIGGAINTGSKTSDISYYAIDTNTWMKIGDLPKAINTPICDIVHLGTNGNIDDWLYCQTGAVSGEFSYKRRLSLV